MVSALQERCQGRAGWYVCQAGSQYEPKTKSESKLRKFSQNSVKNGRCYCQSTVVTNMAPRSPRVTSTEGPFSTKVLAAARTSSLPKFSSESSGCESIWLWDHGFKVRYSSFFWYSTTRTLSLKCKTPTHICSKEFLRSPRLVLVGIPVKRCSSPSLGHKKLMTASKSDEIGRSWSKGPSHPELQWRNTFPRMHYVLCVLWILCVYIYFFNLYYIYREKCILYCRYHQKITWVDLGGVTIHMYTYIWLFDIHTDWHINKVSQRWKACMMCLPPRPLHQHLGSQEHLELSQPANLGTRSTWMQHSHSPGNGYKWHTLAAAKLIFSGISCWSNKTDAPGPFGCWRAPWAPVNSDMEITWALV